MYQLAREDQGEKQKENVVFKGVGLGLPSTNANSSCNFPSNKNLPSNREFQPISLRSRVLLSENGDDAKFDADCTFTSTRGIEKLVPMALELLLEVVDCLSFAKRSANRNMIVSTVILPSFLYDCVLRCFHSVCLLMKSPGKRLIV
ncbi:hypothetical protein SDJN02_05923, partial [Cucurbita argyrosperma subsp. argyrosperma]